MRTKPLKSLAISAIALGAAAVGVTSVAPVAAAPLPQDPPPAPGLPTPDQLANLCNQATDPGVSYTTKTNLVENGIAPDEGHVADHDLRKAYRNGNFPETFAVTNIAPAGPNMAQADVAISGPRFAGPVEKHLAFVNQGGNWVLQHDAAIALIQAATATN
ncbi:hypothetical protein AWB91_02145 [Mycobacterium paraense]|uniref:Low molecular weight antigen MTB12-like C-terminal domain-containing protein n=1 Tax=Mycobacterium paraense TaxID=767916 RepID=A0ABX3VHI4_9MYCO|nr:hypothetical protein [Mycobacterium paraense]ORW28842.1 hypothetical protein AWB91_02145 [Mycobacterium paraense]ORW35842.1 hypothetical protein AWB88_02145 [Mycobacterium paraense]